MPVAQKELESILAGRDPKLLERVLDVGEVWFPEGADAPELAKRLTNALWRRTHSPLGRMVVPDALDDIVVTTAKKLKVDVGEGEVWDRLDVLTDALLTTDRMLTYEELPVKSRKKLEKALWIDLAGVSTAGSAAASRWVARGLLKWTKGPLWDLIKFIPKVGPALGAIRGSAGAVAAVSGPLGVTIALLTLNHTFGPEYDRALSLLLGIGLVCRNPLVNA
ncbi:MAG: hypothetical protein ACI8RZ_002660 [Myxococcota bacterium]|jgi:hypothetical protein